MCSYTLHTHFDAHRQKHPPSWLDCRSQMQAMRQPVKNRMLRDGYANTQACTIQKQYTQAHMQSKPTAAVQNTDIATQ